MARTAQVKPIAGRTDPAAGPIARSQDRDNGDTLRANALENNGNLYTYVGGKRDVSKDGLGIVSAGQWQGLRLEAAAKWLRGSLNRQPVVEAKDDTFTADKVGLWTEADLPTCFDDVEAGVPRAGGR